MISRRSIVESVGREIAGCDIEQAVGVMRRAQALEIYIAQATESEALLIQPTIIRLYAERRIGELLNAME